MMNWACQNSVPAGRAGSGIGRQSELLFARERASVVVADVDDNAGHETVTMIGGDNGCAKFVHASVQPSFLPAELLTAFFVASPPGDPDASRRNGADRQG